MTRRDREFTPSRFDNIEAEAQLCAEAAASRPRGFHYTPQTLKGADDLCAFLQALDLQLMSRGLYAVIGFTILANHAVSEQAPPARKLN